MSTEKLSSNVSLIWDTAEILRGDYKEHEYGDVFHRNSTLASA